MSIGSGGNILDGRHRGARNRRLSRPSCGQRKPGEIHRAVHGGLCNRSQNDVAVPASILAGFDERSSRRPDAIIHNRRKSSITQSHSQSAYVEVAALTHELRNGNKKPREPYDTRGLQNSADLFGMLIGERRKVNSKPWHWISKNKTGGLPRPRDTPSRSLTNSSAFEIFHHIRLQFSPFMAHFSLMVTIDTTVAIKRQYSPRATHCSR